MVYGIVKNSNISGNVVPELDPKFVYVEIFCIGKKYLTIPPPVRVENNNIFKGINYTLTNAALR
jgi:hypothetical protein